MATDTPAIGIDLGTTYSCVAVFYHCKVEVIANVQGNRTTPSCVAFVDSERFIGEAAKTQLATNPSNTIFDAKRLIGRRFDDTFLQSDMRHWPFEVCNDGGRPSIQVEYQGGSRTFFPEEISSMVLARMKETAEAFLGQAVTKAVITVPAYFNDSQRQATKDAGAIAGLDVLRIINEPTAAAIGYGLDRGVAQSSRDRNVLIFDLGGGTFDVSILTIKDGEFKVKSTSGDSHLGGEDFDSRMVDHFVQEYKRKHDQDLTSSKRSLSRLRSACEVAKRALSCDCKAMMNIDSLFEGRDFDATITRAKFEDLNADLFRKTLETVQRALTDAGMDKSGVDDVVLVGGSTRIPKIQKLLKDFFGGKALHTDINPDEAVAYGAAIHAAMLNGNQSEVVKGLRLLDVTPLSLGIRLDGGVMSVVIQRNTPLPAREILHNLTTVVDNQKSMLIAVCEGERAMAADNNLLGEFVFTGFQVAARDVPRITIAFHVNEDGILKVSAEDEKTGSRNEITINKGRLSKDEISRMVLEATKFKADDDRQKARISAKNALESSAYRIRSALDEMEDDISEDDRDELMNMVNDAFEWLDSHKEADAEDFKSENQRLVAEVEELLPLHHLKLI